MIDFKLSDDFVDSYRDKEVPWGYQDGAGNSLGEITFLRTYSRKDDDGRKETWVDTCRRVVEGMFSIQKRHCRTNHIEWKNDKAQRTAKDAFDRLFHMKWLPSGRGLWAMGSDLVMEEGNSAPLQSCAFISTDDSIVDAMTFLFDASMLGVGVGFDADGARKFDVTQPVKDGTFVIPDSREGWVESLRILLASYLDNGKTKLPEFDYSDIRPAGSPIKRFGGVASGSGPLKKMHTQIEAILANRVGDKATMTDIADIGNIIGTCVVSGNVRRCLPEGTKVHTTSGLVNIEDIKIGDTVEVAGKTAKVSNFFDQGVQETVIVKYDGGQIECTPNHRLAVFDTLTSWTFKRADELTTDDRLVWDRHGITGVSNNQMPAHNHVKRPSDTTGQDIVIPDLDTDSAWLIGLIHGDGYVFLPSGTTPNGHVMIASAPDTPEVLAKAQEQLARYGVRVRIQPPREDDKAIRVYANSSQLADYMYKNVKQANTSITIPDWIKTSAKEIRAAYLAGLMDADGSYKTRPLQAIVTIYPEFASQVVDLYTSLGIQARAKMCRPAIGNWKALYTVDIVGGHNIRAFEEMISQYSMKRGDDVRPSRSRGGATFSTSMVREAGIKGPHVFNPPANRQNAERVEKVLGITLPALPYQVLEVVPSGRSVQTYDIEVKDIHQFTANGLVVHNSAEIFFVDRDSDSLYEFLHLKDYDKNPERGAWGFISNNSVRVSVGDDLTPLMDGIKLNGEPGVVWMDVIRKYGRLIDAPDYKDTRVRGLNPCFPADTLLATEEGWTTFGEAYRSGEAQNILVDGRVTFEESTPGEESPEDWKIDLSKKYDPQIMQASHVFLTQRDAPIVKVSLSTGIDLRCTPDHLIATKEGMVRADELTPEHKVLITRGFTPTDGLPNLTVRENIDGFLMGLVAGDGYIDSGKLTEKVYVDLWGDDREIAPTVIGWIDDLFDQFKDKYVSQSNRQFTAHNVEHREDRDQIRIKSSFLAAYLNGEYGFNKASKHVVPSKFISQSTSSAARAYVAGLAFADGTVNKYNKVGSSSIRIGQANKSFLQDVQRILLSNGIFSSVYSRSKAGPREMKGKTYIRKEFFELVVMMNTYEYTNHVGFGFGHKQALAQQLFTKRSRKQATYATAVSVVDDGVEDVYCLRENTRRILSANGVTARRCSEQPLESSETCVLGEVFINNCDDQDDFIKTLKVAYLYGKTVTLMPTKWEKTNTVMQRNRRIGLSASGVADFVDAHGMAELRSVLDDGFNYVLKLDKKYSEWLCIRESIRHTTMKPSGSISILAGSSPGTHWTPGGEYFIRRITFAKSDPLFQQLLDSGYEHETLDHDPNSAVILFPIHSKSKRASSDVPAWEKIHLASEIQAWWSDNGVSCTVDFKPSEAEDIPTLLAMYDGKLKGISFLPAIEGGAYKHMPYEGISKEKFEEMRSSLQKAHFGVAYSDGKEAEGEKFCATDFCEIEEEISESEGEPKVEVPLLDMSSL